jgi:hypothetical protein
MSSKQILGLIAGLVIVIGGTAALFFLSNEKQPDEVKTASQNAQREQSDSSDASRLATATSNEPDSAKTATVTPQAAEKHAHAHGDEGQDHADPENQTTPVDTAEAQQAESPDPLSGTIDAKVTETMPSPEPVRISGDGNQVTISLDESIQADMGTRYDKAVIELSGPQNYEKKQELTAGSSMTLSGGLPDGIYKWEAVTVPRIPDTVKQELSTFRESGNVAKMNEMMEKYREQGLFPTEEEISDNRTSGSFRIHEGSIVDNTEEE